jgi:hypothetical protein
MSRNETKSPEPRTAEGPEMIRLMRQGVVDALLEHKRQGQSVVVWDREANQAVHVKPEDIVIPELESKVTGTATLPTGH